MSDKSSFYAGESLVKVNRQICFLRRVVVGGIGYIGNREVWAIVYTLYSAECNSHPTQRINDAVEIRIRESQDESLFDLRCPPHEI